MPVYKITTEGDCEGRTIRDLGFVQANSPEHAIKYLESKGIHAYYAYEIKEVNDVIQIACAEEELSHLSATVAPSNWNNVVLKGQVFTNDKILQNKKKMLREAMKKAGISYEDVINFGKGVQ